MVVFRQTHRRCFKIARSAFLASAVFSAQTLIAEPKLENRDPTIVEAELEAARQKIQAEQQAAKKLREQQESIEKELKRTREKAVSHAEKAVALEEELIKLEAEQAQLQQDIASIRKKLERDSDDLDQVLRALQRHSKAPSEVLLLLHNDPAAAGRAGQLLTGLYKRHDAQLADLRRSLRELAELQKQSKQNTIQVKNRQQALEKEHASIKKLQRQKQQKLDKTAGEILKKQQQAKQIAVEATSIETLLKDIEKNLNALPKPGLLTLRKIYGPQKIKETIRKKPSATKPPTRLSKNTQKAQKKRHQTARTVRSSNKLIQPVAGSISSRFGSTIQGVRQTGIRYKTRNSAVVRAPASGKVVYAGTFRGYGNMVIIAHQKSLKNIHTVLGNLGRTDISTGQWLNSGEPLGRTGKKPLYLEVRRNGKAVNPEKYLK